MSSAIRVENLSKLYRRVAPGFKLRTLKSALLDRSLTEGLRPEETIQALENVSFEVKKGTSFGVIGSNGSGKSTLLKILVGMLQPTTGSIEVSGRVAALIELGAGFHPEISGRENVFINGAVLGLSRRQIEQRYDEIIEFSGLGDYIEEPVKNYSSGMYVRLGFAVAVHTDPEVLLVDEVLAVGDEAFQHRCLRRIEEFLAGGKTLLLVSHSLSLIEAYSDQVLWLEGGKKRLLGSPRQVADAYRLAVAEEEGKLHLAAKEQRLQEIEQSAATSEVSQEGVEVADGQAPAEADEVASRDSEPEPPAEDEPRRWGSREVEIGGVRLLADDGEERYHFATAESLTFEITARSEDPIDNFVFGVGIFTPRGIECWGTNTHIEGFVSKRLEGEVKARLVCPALRLAPGDYLLDVAVHARDGKPYDYHSRFVSFTMTSPVGGVGIYYPEHDWEFDGKLSWKRVPGDESGD